MAVLLEKLEKDGEVPLERYGHQVGGRQLLLKYKDCLCKPLIPRERFFYETAPEAVRRYLPQYYGVVSVNYVKQPSGEIQVLASLKDPQQQERASKQQQQAFPKCTNGHSNGISVTSSKIANTAEYFTPWAQMCSDNMDKGLKQLAGDLQDFNKDYVILENLTTKFKAPSVLDLKVGTNWPGENPSSQATPHSANTSWVRMAGMQKFDCQKNRYTFCDKYFGKQFTELEFREVLRSFLNNGVCFRSDLLNAIIKMLEDLRTSIKRHPSFRYFSSSLLLIYDGSECPLNCSTGQDTRQYSRRSARLRKRKNQERVESKQVEDVEDSESSVVSSKRDSEGKMSSSKRVRTESNIETESIVPTIITQDVKNIGVTPTSNGVDKVIQERLSASLYSDDIADKNARSCAPLSSDYSCCPPNLKQATPMLMPASELTECRRSVDLRMIDFARSTHGGHFDQVVYEGLDDCYLTGLSSLLRIFREMRDEEAT